MGYLINSVQKSVITFMRRAVYETVYRSIQCVLSQQNVATCPLADEPMGWDGKKSSTLAGSCPAGMCALGLLYRFQFTVHEMVCHTFKSSTYWLPGVIHFRAVNEESRQQDIVVTVEGSPLKLPVTVRDSLR